MAGAGERLAGVACYSDHPSAARRLPVVSDAVHFDSERMLALRAGLMLAWLGGTPPDVIARIERAGLPVFVAGAAGLDDIANNITAIAQLAGTPVAGAAARAAFDADLRVLRSRRNDGPPVRVFYEIWDRPLMTVNKDHLISEIIGLCGGVNVFGDLRTLTPEVAREALLTARPDIVLGGSSADSFVRFCGTLGGTAAAAQYAASSPSAAGPDAAADTAGARRRERVCAYLDAARAAQR